jgi:hypothetical protein
MSATRRAREIVVSMIVAAGLVGCATGVRGLLSPLLGDHAPFMLYIGATLLAGFLRGPLCGAMVIAAGGALGISLFLSPQNGLSPGMLAETGIFLVVAGLVLLVSNELRLGLKATMDRVRALPDRDRLA